MVTRRKERNFGIWINTDYRQFLKVPSYLALFANRPFDVIASPEVAAAAAARAEQRAADPARRPRLSPTWCRTIAFRRAFMRLRTQHGLYREDTSAVTFLTPTLFRTGIPLPAEVPIGTYEVEIKLFANGALVGQDRDRVRDRQGRLRAVRRHHCAQNSLVYGLVTAAMALMTGWMASIVFRKD